MPTKLFQNKNLSLLLCSLILIISACKPSMILDCDSSSLEILCPESAQFYHIDTASFAKKAIKPTDIVYNDLENSVTATIDLKMTVKHPKASKDLKVLNQNVKFTFEDLGMFGYFAEEIQSKPSKVSFEVESYEPEPVAIENRTEKPEATNLSQKSTTKQIPEVSNPLNKPESLENPQQIKSIRKDSSILGILPDSMLNGKSINIKIPLQASDEPDIPNDPQQVKSIFQIAHHEPKQVNTIKLPQITSDENNKDQQKPKLEDLSKERSENLLKLPVEVVKTQGITQILESFDSSVKLPEPEKQHLKERLLTGDKVEEKVSEEKVEQIKVIPVIEVTNVENNEKVVLKNLSEPYVCTIRLKCGLKDGPREEEQAKKII